MKYVSILNISNYIQSRHKLGYEAIDYKKLVLTIISMLKKLMQIIFEEPI